MKSNTPLSCWCFVILELNKLLKTSFDGLCLHKTNPYVSTTTLWLNGIVSSPKESRAFHKGRKSLQKGRLIIQKRHFQFRDSTEKEKGARCLFMGLRNKSSCCATGAKKEHPKLHLSCLGEMCLWQKKICLVTVSLVVLRVWKGCLVCYYLIRCTLVVKSLPPFKRQ